MSMTPKDVQIASLEALLKMWERLDDNIGQTDEQLTMCGCPNCAATLRLRRAVLEYRALYGAPRTEVTSGGNSVH